MIMMMMMMMMMMMAEMVYGQMVVMHTVRFGSQAPIGS